MKINWQWRKAALINGIKDATAYRIEFFFEVVGSALIPASIQMIIWYALFKVNGASEVAGMTYIQMIHYTIASVLFSQIRGGDLDFQLQEMIRTGSLSNYLLRPVSFIQFIYLRGSAEKFLITILSLVIGCLFGFLIGITPDRMIGAVFMAFLGNVIHFLIGAALSTTAFAWEEAYSVLMIKNMIVSLLCGEMIPLNLFPQNMQWIWKYTPFYLYVYGPTQFALGHWSAQTFFFHLAIAGGWIFGLYFLVRLFWAIGIKRYASIGG